MALLFCDGFDNPQQAKWTDEEARLRAFQILKNACMHLIDARSIDVAALRVLRRCYRKMLVEETSRAASRLDGPDKPTPGLLIGGGWPLGPSGRA